MTVLSGNAAAIGTFLAGTPAAYQPPEVQSAASNCLLDWLGVTIAGSAEPVARAAAIYAGAGEHPAPWIGAGPAAEQAALINGAAAHALDFDDTHIPTDSHLSAVIWAALLAQAEPGQHSGMHLLKAFVAGYEVAAMLARRRMGFSLQFRWFHPTAVLGRIAAAAASAALAELGDEPAAHAAALSMTMAGGLRASSGGMGKPLQAGCAARDGVAAVRLANAGVTGSLALLEPGGGFARAFVQDGYADLADLSDGGLGEDWAVLRTSVKPYACLHGIHPSIDAARAVAAQTAAADIVSAQVFVAPGVKQVGHFTDPHTPLEAKFSVAFCAAMALAGKACAASDYSADTLADPEIRRLCRLIEVVPEDGRKMLNSRVTVTFADGTEFSGETALSRGHPGNALSPDELAAKFRDLARPTLGAHTDHVLDMVRRFDQLDNIADLAQVLKGR